MTKVLTVMGTRPEAIKLAPVLLELAARPDTFQSILCSTGQHREMLQQVNSWFGLQPNIDLDLMTANQDVSEFAARSLAAIARVMAEARPDVVVVQGDTTTAMIAALAAAYRKTPVAHVEAGLRTFDLYNPFPEEINRRLVSVVARHHFAPTARSADVLRRESVEPALIHVTGNTVIDALRLTTARLPRPSPRPEGERRILVTTHRRESFGDAMRESLTALRLLADRNPGVVVQFPVHLNPNVRGPAHEILGGHPRIRLSEPLGYERFVAAMVDCDLILTDSGGIQEEAPYLGKPVLVMRDNTERPEAVECGTAMLVGTDSAAIVREAERLLRNPDDYAAMVRADTPFGDGYAAKRIVDILQRG